MYISLEKSLINDRTRLFTDNKIRNENNKRHLLVELNHHMDQFLFLTFRLGLRHPFPSQMSQKGGSVHLLRELSLAHHRRAE